MFLWEKSWLSVFQSLYLSGQLPFLIEVTTVFLISAISRERNDELCEFSYGHIVGILCYSALMTTVESLVIHGLVTLALLICFFHAEKGKQSILAGILTGVFGALLSITVGDFLAATVVICLGLGVELASIVSLILMSQNSPREFSGDPTKLLLPWHGLAIAALLLGNTLSRMTVHGRVTFIYRFAFVMLAIVCAQILSRYDSIRETSISVSSRGILSTLSNFDRSSP